MHAFSAAKRTALLAAGIFLLATPLAFAGDSSGYLGVMLQDLDESMAKALQLDGKSGVIVTGVVDESPAAKVGLEDGDVILMFDGEAIASTGDLTKAVRAAGAGEEVEMVILHNGKEQKLTVELGEHEGGRAWITEGDGEVWTFKRDGDEDFHLQMLKELQEDLGDVHMEFFGQADRGFMGVQLDDVTGQLADYFDVEGGALITEVNEDSPAAKAGLKAGDVIVQVGDEKIESSADVHRTMQDTEPGQELKVKVVRKGDDKSMKVTLGEMPEDMAFKDIQIYSDGDHLEWTAPKMLMHGKHGDPHHQYRVLKVGPEGKTFFHDSKELQQMQMELQEMKKELEKMKKELEK